MLCALCDCENYIRVVRTDIGYNILYTVNLIARSHFPDYLIYILIYYDMLPSHVLL